MNIFYSDKDPFAAAVNLCRIHRNKMIVESAQLLSTAHRVLDDADGKGLYALSHKNHPCAIWVRQSDKHYQWLFVHMAYLMTLYTKQSGKRHATELTCRKALSKLPRNIPKDTGWSDPPFCASKEYKDTFPVLDSLTENYASYLAWKYREWRSRPVPLRVEF